MVRRNILHVCQKIQQKKVIIHRLSFFLFIFQRFTKNYKKHIINN